MSSFEEAVNIQLVREVEKHPVLYNYRLPDYSKRDQVEAAWNEVAEKMKDDAQYCKEKWRNLRTVFVRRLKPLPSRVTKRKSYYLGDAMSFLAPFIKLQRSEDTTESVSSPAQSETENVTCLEEPDHNEGDEGDNPINQEIPNNLISNGYSNTPRRAVNKRASVSDYVESKRTRYSETDDSRKYFLLSLLPEVQRLTDNQMKFFRRKLLDALDDAEAYPPEKETASFFNEDIIRNEAYFHECSPKKEC